MATTQDDLTTNDNPFDIGQSVSFMIEQTRYAGIIEDIVDETYTVRVMAVAGNEFEPTDKIYFMTADALSSYEQHHTEGKQVRWNSEAGETSGQIVSITGDVACVEVYSGEDELEPTRVMVDIPLKALKAHKFTVKKTPQSLLCKMEDVALSIDDEKNIGVIEGWGSTYGNVDLGGDTVEKGAYTQTLRHKNNKVQMFFDHGWSVPTMAGVAFMEDKDQGLWVRGELPLDATDVKNAFIKIKFAIDNQVNPGLSIGYNPVKYSINSDGTRSLKEIALEEMTITPFPMDTHAKILEARAKSITYKAMQSKWAKLSDAPNGNQGEQGATALVEIKSILNLVKEKWQK